MTLPLEGVRVLEVANWLAAPAAAAMIGDLGADVIKVEPPGGDDYRGAIARVGVLANLSTSFGFQLVSRGKRSVTVALRSSGRTGARPAAREGSRHLSHQPAPSAMPTARARFRYRPRCQQSELTGAEQHAGHQARPGSSPKIRFAPCVRSLAR